MARLPLVKPMKAFSASSRQLERKDMRIAIRAFRSDTSRASSLSSSCSPLSRLVIWARVRRQRRPPCRPPPPGGARHPPVHLRESLDELVALGGGGREEASAHHRAANTPGGWDGVRLPPHPAAPHLGIVVHDALRLLPPEKSRAAVPQALQFRLGLLRPGEHGGVHPPRRVRRPSRRVRARARARRLRLPLRLDLAALRHRCTVVQRVVAGPGRVGGGGGSWGTGRRQPPIPGRARAGAGTTGRAELRCRLRGTGRGRGGARGRQPAPRPRRGPGGGREGRVAGGPRAAGLRALTHYAGPGSPPLPAAPGGVQVLSWVVPDSGLCRCRPATDPPRAGGRVARGDWGV